LKPQIVSATDARPNTSTRKTVLVWDLPTRLFHWALVVLVIISFYTGLEGGMVEMDYHMLSGFGLLAIILFRIAWGFAAKSYANFKHFALSPKSILVYLKSDPVPKAGHSPLGALSVLAMLTALLIQAISGLFANDDIMLEGPLAYLVDSDLSGSITGIHHIMIWVIGGLVVFHLLAIAFYEVSKKRRLTRAMILGRIQLDETQLVETETQHQLVKALALIILTSGFVYGLVTYL